MTAPASATDFRIRFGTADFVSRREAVRTVSLPNASIAAPHRGFRVVQRRRRHQQLGDVGLELVVGGAVFGVAESAEKHRAVVDGDLVAAQVAVRDLVVVQVSQRFPHPGDRRRRWRIRRAGSPRMGLCAYNVQPRSRAATRSSRCWPHPASPMAMAISARCSTARRIDACRGAVSVSRSRSLRHSWRSAPPLL